MEKKEKVIGAVYLKRSTFSVHLPRFNSTAGKYCHNKCSCMLILFTHTHAQHTHTHTHTHTIKHICTYECSKKKQKSDWGKKKGEIYHYPIIVPYFLTGVSLHFPWEPLVNKPTDLLTALPSIYSNSPSFRHINGRREGLAAWSWDLKFQQEFSPWLNYNLYLASIISPPFDMLNFGNVSKKYECEFRG